jgi:hypothetical protein
MAEITGTPGGSIKTQKGKRKITILLPDDVDMNALNLIDSAKQVTISTGQLLAISDVDDDAKIMRINLGMDLDVVKSHIFAVGEMFGMTRPEVVIDAPLLAAMKDKPDGTLRTPASDLVIGG